MILLVDSNTSKDSRELIEKIILGTVAVQEPFKIKVGRTPTTIIMVGNNPAVAAEMPGTIFIDYEKNPDWENRLKRLVENSSPQHTTVMMPQTLALNYVDPIGERVWLSYDPEKDMLSAEEVQKMHKLLMLTADLGPENLIKLLGASAESCRLPNNDKFYVARKIRENKAMIQLQNEIYTNRKVAASA